MADGVFRFPGAGPSYLYQPQNQQPHNPRHFQHQRNGSPVNPRIGFHNNDTPSPNRSPGTHSPAFNMFSHGQHQSQHSLLNGGQPHHRYQMQMNMPKGYPGSASQHQGAHGQHQHLDHASTNGYGSHQHNMSSSTLTSSTPHFTPAHLQSNTPVGNHSALSRPSGAHWDEQIRVAQQTREAIAPHYYARNSSGSNKQTTGGLQDDTKKDDDKTRKLKPLQGSKEEKHIWDALDFSGQGLRSISSFLFRYPFLESLYFNRNKLSWLTPQIGQLKCLTYLDLSQNHLEALPGEIGMLTNLKTLLLVDNNLESLPFELGYLYKLKTLGIDGNPLNEDIRNIIAEEGVSGLVSYMKENAETPAPPEDREWHILDETPMAAAEQDRFTIFDQNILCPTYVNSTQYPYVPSGALAWEHRRDVIMREIRLRDADIICLQEINSECYNEDFRETLAHQDYRGVFWQKSRAQTMADREAKRVDGCATFYKGSKYILLDKQIIDFRKMAINRADMKGEHDIFNRVMVRDDIATVTFLENRMTGSRLIVVNTHIFWNPEFADVKCVQIAILMEQLAQLSEKYVKWPACSEKEKKGFEFASVDSDTENEAPRTPMPSIQYTKATDIPLVVCGDFNSTPGSGPYDLIAHGSLSNSHADLSGRSYGAFTRDGMHHPFSLKSTYSNIGEMEFTNYTAEWQGVVDYIWYSTNALNNTGLLGEIDRGYLQRIPGFPSYHFPSDHLPLFAEFVVKGKKEKKVVEADFGPQRDRHRN